MQKLFVVFVVGLLSACSTTPEYFLETHNNMESLAKKERVVFVEKNNASVEDVRMGDTVQAVLKNNGWQVVDSKAKANMIASYKTELQTTQRTESRPVYGRTGVNSINSYGTSSTVNYDYGITGYENYVVNVNVTCFKLALNKLDKKTQTAGEPVFNSDFCTSSAASPVLLRAYVDSVYSLYLDNPDAKKVFACSSNGTELGNCVYKRDF